MQKQPLPGWAFMIAGIAIMAYTKFIESKAPTSKIGIFFYLGIILLLFGAYREFAPRLKKKPKETLAGPPQKREPAHAQPTHLGQTHQHVAGNTHASHQHVKPAQYPSHPYQPPSKACPRCHGVEHPQSKYCRHCGFQFY